MEYSDGHPQQVEKIGPHDDVRKNRMSLKKIAAKTRRKLNR